MISFISFADSFKNNEAATRIQVEAEKMNTFTNVTIYNETLLDEKFFSDHQNFILKNRRGFGYWIWKPQILIQELKKVQNGDTIVYADAGCTLNANGINRLKEYIQLSKEYGIVGFHNHTEERIWTKNDLFDLFNYTNPSTQVVTGCYIVTKSEKTVEFANLWLQTAIRDNYHFVDDSKSLSKNYALFREHRHDQSIFSILIRKYFGKILDYEIRERTNFPILATRKINK